MHVEKIGSCTAKRGMCGGIDLILGNTFFIALILQRSNLYCFPNYSNHLEALLLLPVCIMPYTYNLTGMFIYLTIKYCFLSYVTGYELE